MKFVNVLFVVLLYCTHLSAQVTLPNNLYFTHIGVEDGLCQNTVCCILQDHLGFIWLGTKDGLTRYDGYRFRVFKHDAADPMSIGNNFIRVLYEDADGLIWIGTNVGVYIYNPETENFRKFDVATERGDVISREVSSIKCDSSGDLWIGVNWQGVFRYDRRDESLELYEPVPGDTTSLSSVHVWDLCFDGDGNLWVGSQNGGLDRYDRETDRFVRHRLKGLSDVSRIVLDKQNQLLLGTMKDGLFSFNPYMGTCQPLLLDSGHKDLFVRAIFVRNSREVVVGTENGIYIYDCVTRKTRHVNQELGNPYSLSCKAVYSIYCDKEGALWIGTYFGGVNYLPPSSSLIFDKFYPIGHSDRLSGKAVREFVRDESGIIWIGTEDQGLNRFDPVSGKFTHYNSRNSGLSCDNVHGLCVDGDRLYIGTFFGGFNIMDLKTNEIVALGSQMLPDDSVFSIFRDHDGRIWVGLTYGLCLFHPEDGSFELVREIPENLFIYDIYQGDDGIIYFAAYNRGVITYNPHTGKWGQVESGDEGLLKHVVSINEDSAFHIWFGTEGRGAVRYTPSSGDLTAYTTRDGLPNDVVYKVIEDKNKNLWISTNKGLACYEPLSGNLKVYTSGNGLTSDQFNYKSGFRDLNGKLYFGTINGFVSFSPEQFITSSNLAPVVMTDLKLNDRSSEICGPRSPLNASMPYTDKIKLRYDQSLFTIDFAMLSYNASSRNQYRYIMRNYIDNWIEIEQPSVTFSNVPPGKYVFEVRGANGTGMWNDQPARLEIEIRPPFYASTMAYVVYVLSIVVIVWLYVSWYVRKTRQRSDFEIRELKRKQERQEYRAKIAFFTNITHEIRTPLSLIRGPYEQIVRPGIRPSDYKENLKIMGANIDRLLNLSNQLLDFQKIDRAGFALNRSDVNLNDLLERCMLQFAQKMQQKGIRSCVSVPDDQVVLYADEEALTKIVCNLLDNAVKHAQNRVGLCLEAAPERDRVVISIENDGDAIPGIYFGKIFEPFFQIKGDAKGGTGLGLSLVKHLVEQHEGNISVFSDASSSRFVVDLPWQKKAVPPPVTAGTDIPPRGEGTDPVPEMPALLRTKTDGRLCHVLVIDDDKGMLDFLRRLMSKSYRVSVADNADEAFGMLDSEDVNLIITDVMMPQMDGFELCKFLKARKNYSHIPIVMLSAKSDTASKIAGLEAGAAAYIEKPFSGDYLMAQIATILENRSLFRETPLIGSCFSVDPNRLNKADQLFLNRLTDIINSNISEQDLTVNHIARYMAMSRSNLHRRIKGLLHMPPNDFIRLIKLQKAAELLLDGEYRINEICYMTGFNSASYFAKCFQKQFGVLPKYFVSHMKKRSGSGEK